MAGRRGLEIGQHGNISFQTLGRRDVRARCKVRDADTVIRHATARGTSNADARDKLLAALARRPGHTSSELSSSMRLADLLDLWLADLDVLAERGERALNTPRTYRSVVNSHVRDGVGALELREATAPRLDVFLSAMRARHGVAVTKTARTVLSAALGFAIRKGALPGPNPVRDVGRLAVGRRGPKRQPRALTQVERDAWLARIEADEVAVARDLPDLCRWLLATGCRIAEALAVTFDEIDVDDKRVTIDGQIVRVKGRGLLRTPTKSAAGERTLTLPGWAVDMVRERGERLRWSGPLFPIPAQRRGGQRWTGGTWRDPSNTSRDLRQARGEDEYRWLTSHAFRRTTATMLHESGRVPRDVADQLGHGDLRTQRHYIGRVSVVDHSDALADMFGQHDTE